MARMGVKEFRDRFSAIARDGRETVVVTSHNKVVGWYTPARGAATPEDRKARDKELAAFRKRLAARGVDIVGARRDLDLED